MCDALSPENQFCCQVGQTGNDHPMHYAVEWVGLKRIEDVWENTDYVKPVKKTKAEMAADAIKKARAVRDAAAVVEGTPGRIHHDDPDTSRQAAAVTALKSGSHKARILLELARQGDHGATPHELWLVTGGAFPNVSATRCADLRDIGLCEMTEDTRLTPRNIPSHVWKITEAGVAAAEELRGTTLS